MKFRARVTRIEPGTTSWGDRPVHYVCTARDSTHATDDATFTFPCDVEEARALFDAVVDIDITVVDPVPAQ